MEDKDPRPDEINAIHKEHCVQQAFDGLAFTLDVIAGETFGLAQKKGWGGNEDLVDTALIHSEVAEITEACRKDPPQKSSKIPDFLEVEEEAADVFIRLINFCKERKLRLGEAVRAKHNFNKGREHKHGGKKF